MAKFFARFLPFCAALPLQCFSAQASSVISLSFSEVVARAEIIVQASVVEGSTHTVIRGEAPWTCEVLAVSKSIKGPAANELTLCFLGGQIDGENYTVTDITMPEEGRDGFFFLYDGAHNYTNPIVGWTQGAYYIEEVSGKRIVTTLDHSPIAKIELGVDTQRAGAVAATGIITDPKGALSEAEFLQAIQDAGVTP